MRSARCLMWSFDFGEIEVLQDAGRWDDAARSLERRSAENRAEARRVIHDGLVQGWVERALSGHRGAGSRKARPAPCPGVARKGSDVVV